MKTLNPHRRLFRAVAPLLLTMPLAHAVPLDVPAVADINVSENDGLDGASLANAPDMNARFNNSTRNEILVLRFNLAGYDRAAIEGAAIRLVNQRPNSSSSNSLRIYGVNDDATGYNAIADTEGTGTDDNWPEDHAFTTFSTTPGLEFDANSLTRGIMLDRVTDLGTGSTAPVTEGSVVSIGTTALKDFIITHPDDVVTILVEMVTPAGGQLRYATKEATALESGGAAPAGTYAPKLRLDFPGVRLPAVADSELREQNNYPNGGNANGTGTQLNARWIPNATVPTGNNEVIALKFDLTGYTPSDILGADVRLTNYRDNDSDVPLQFYGVIDGSTGYNTLTATEGTLTDDDWTEASMIFANAPGLEYDGSTQTRGIRGDRTVLLGTVSANAANGNKNKGTKVVLATAELTDFLKNHPDNVVTILVLDSSSGTEGQKRFASREATNLDGGTPETAGTYAPEINLLVANIDRDGDGLRNNWEELWGLDPDLMDTDGDEIADGEEDEDEDFSNNLNEQLAGTHPFDPDTDMDGLLDGYETGTGFWSSEIDTGTNPLVADTDGDGLSDGVENPELPYVDAFQPGTDPHNRDSDFDIYSDGAEIARGSDPADGAIVPDDVVLDLLGTGTGALLGSPLTDPDNNIDDSTPAGSGFDWAAVTTTEKPFFGTGALQVDPQNLSGAYDLFDHKVGPLNDKWLAGGLAAPGGAHTTVEFKGEVELTHFTIASADDRPERDPVAWQILGSTDGVVFTPIFTQTDPAGLTIWTQRLQVVRATLPAAAPKYRYLRFACTSAGEGTFHLNEIEYFGTFTPDAAPADFRITGFSGAPGAGNISLTWLSEPGASYRIVYSTTMDDGFPGIAAGDIPAEAGATTTHVFANPMPAEPKLFFRVEKP